MSFFAIHHCTQCGTATQQLIPEGDNRLRAVCPACQHVEYQNPKVVVGCVAEWQGQIVLARRAIEPRHGFWTLPAGFMENGESAAAGAAREALEEANARVNITSLYAMYTIPSISQIVLMYRAELLDANIWAGDESLEVKLVREADIPWNDLAFIMVKRTLSYYFADQRRGSFVFREEIIEWDQSRTKQ